jgi:hypothetical protein
MRLPAKYLPRQSQHIGNVVGAGIIIVMGLAFMMSYLPDRVTTESLTFSEWIGANRLRLPFLLITIAVLLFGLTVLSVALVNLFGGSPFNHLIVDRFGIRNRTFFGETLYSWKELGPIRSLRLSALRAYGLDRRFWIVSDTFSGEGRKDARRPLSTFNLRIPATAYLGSSWMGGDTGAATDSMAAWLDSLRKLAREETLNPDDVPDAPEELGPGLAIARPSAEAAAPPTPAPDLPAMADRKFGRRDGPTVER